MSNGYVIEIDDVAAGLLIREGNTFAFHAVEPAWRSLEGRIFSGPYSAERAARRLARTRSTAEKPARPFDRDEPRWAGSMLSGAGSFARPTGPSAVAPL